MRRLDWWLGVGLVVVALVLHALVPRFEVVALSSSAIRFDRWTGTVELVSRQQPWFRRGTEPSLPADRPE